MANRTIMWLKIFQKGDAHSVRWVGRKRIEKQKLLYTDVFNLCI